MKKIKFFSMLLVMLFGLTLSGVINANAETNYVFTADYAMTGENNVFTMTSTRSFVVTSVSGVDLTGDVYVSIMFESKNVVDYDLHVFGEGVTDYVEVVYKGGTEAYNKTEFTKTGDVVISTANIKSELVSNGFTSLSHVKYEFRGNSNDVIEILDFAITTDGAHGFEVPTVGGGNEEPEAPVEPEQPTGPAEISTFYGSSQFTGTIEGTEEGLVKATLAKKQGYAQLRTKVSNFNINNTYMVVDFSISHTMTVSFDIGGSYDGHPTYQAGRNTAKVDISTWPIANEFVLGLYLDSNESTEYPETEPRVITIHSIEFLNVNEYDPNRPLTVEDFYGSAYSFSKNELGEQIVICNTKPGYELLCAPIFNHNVENTMLILTYTSDREVDFGFKTNVNSEYTSHKRFPAGKNTIKVDISSLTTKTYFELQMYVDCNYSAEAWTPNNIVIHSLSFSNPNTYDSNLPTIFGDFNSNSSLLSVNKNLNGEQVVTYGTEGSTTTMSYDTITALIENYDKEKSVFEFTYSSNQSLKLGFMFNGDYIGHILYPAGENKVVKVDLTHEKFTHITANLELKIYFDAEQVVENIKVVTIHSMNFVEPSPVGEPVGSSGVQCTEVSDGWKIDYTANSWDNINVSINANDIVYDAVKIKFNLGDNTNIGIIINYKDANGVADKVTVRDHWGSNSIFTTGGDVAVIYFLAAYGLSGVEITSIQMYLDPQTGGSSREGNQSIILQEIELIDSSKATFDELEYSLDKEEVDYTGEAADVNVVCDAEVEFKVQHALVVEGQDLVWYSGFPISGGTYKIRVTYLGSLQYAYQYKEFDLTINKVNSTVNIDDVTVDGVTRVVTVKDGIEASTSAEFAAGSEINNGDVVEYGTVIYYRHEENNNYFASEALSLTFIKPLSVYKDEVKAELAAYKNAEDYREAQQTELAAAIVAGNTAIDAAENEEAVDAALVAAKATIDTIKTNAQLTAEELAAAKAAAIAKVVQTIGEYEIDKASYETSINEATTIEEVEIALEAALEDIDAKIAVIDLANAKVEAIADVVEVIGEYEIDKATYETSINAATTIEEVEIALEAALEDIDTKKAAIDLANAKTNAITTLASYKSADLYREAQKEELEAAIAAGNAAINVVTTIEEVENALATAKANIDKIKTDAQLTAEELVVAKNAAKEALASYKSKDLYREAEQAQLAAAIEAGNAAIEAAADKAKVADELAAAKEVIDGLKLKATYEAEEALAAAKTTAKSALASYKDVEDYREAQQAELAAAIAAGNTTIDSATTIQAVENALAAAKLSIDKIKTDEQLTKEEQMSEAERQLNAKKETAIDELESYKKASDYREAQQAQLTAAIAAGNTAINAATTIEEVETALATAKANIDKIKTDAQLTAEELALAKTEAKEALAIYKDAEAYREAQQAELAAAIVAGNAAIDAAADEEAVAEALAAAKAIIDAIKTNAQLTAEELAAAKTTAKAALDTYKNPADYRDAEKAQLASIVSAGKLTINEATTVAEVEQALNTIKTSIDALKTNAQLTAEELAAAKTEAKETLASYKSKDLYREAEQAQLTAAIAAGNTAIDAATTTVKVTEALAAAKAVIDGLKLKATYEAEELAAAKTEAKETLATYKSADLYRDAEKAQLTAAIAAGNTAIDAATTTVKVTEALAAAKVAIDALKTNAELTAEELAAAKTTAKAELAAYKSADLYREAEQAQLTAAIAAGNTAIDAAATVEAVATELAAAKAVIDGLKLKATYEAEELAAAKVAAKAELAAYKSADLYKEAERTQLTTAISNGNVAIDAATTEVKVAEALAAAKEVIDGIKTKAEYEAEAAEALANAKADAKEALASYKSADLYREAEQTALAAAIKAGNTAIDAASSEDLVAFALTTAKARIDALKTKAQYEAEEEAAAKELAKAKTDAKEALASYKSKDLYREAEQAKLAAAIAAGNTAIDAATSKSEVSVALATAKATIDTLKTKIVYEAEEKQAAEALAKAKADAIAEISKEIGTYSIDKAQYESKINAAKSVEEVKSELAKAKEDIAAKKAAIDKENEKEPEQPVEPEKPKKGCKGAIVPSILSVIALLGVCFTFKRKEQE